MMPNDIPKMSDDIHKHAHITRPPISLFPRAYLFFSEDRDLLDLTGHVVTDFPKNRFEAIQTEAFTTIDSYPISCRPKSFMMINSGDLILVFIGMSYFDIQKEAYLQGGTVLEHCVQRMNYFLKTIEELPFKGGENNE